MQRLRTHLSGCIGCGCLSLKNCALVNPDDVVASHGSGARYVMEEPEELYDDVVSRQEKKSKQEQKANT